MAKNQVKKMSKSVGVGKGDGPAHAIETTGYDASTVMKTIDINRYMETMQDLGYQGDFKGGGRVEDDVVGDVKVFYSRLPWMERQLVKEWRTCSLGSSSQTTPSSPPKSSGPSPTPPLPPPPSPKSSNPEYDVIPETASIKLVLPPVLSPPPFSNSDRCSKCMLPFSSTLYRHHCRSCGGSFCGAHSARSKTLPMYGYGTQVEERVCDECDEEIESEERRERIRWRLARLRDFKGGLLTPYFTTGSDTLADLASRLADGAIAFVRSIPLGMQVAVAFEAAEILRKHGMNGIYTLVLRKEFVAAAGLLQRVAR